MLESTNSISSPTALLKVSFSNETEVSLIRFYFYPFYVLSWIEAKQIGFEFIIINYLLPIDKMLLHDRSHVLHV